MLVAWFRHVILDDFDRLMPLYDYVEGAATFPALTTQRRRGFEWSPGNKARVTRTSFERKKQTVDKALRHNVLQDKLFRHLEKLHGESNTSGEQDCGKGTPIDVAIVTGKGYTYYEIKTGLSARSCIREALGQLMEYSFWPGTQQAIKLVVVGEPPLDADARKYLNTLRKKFSLPVYYQQFKIKSGKLIA
ncbi:MAG: hypothetical protein IH968_13645 [Gemmatimonadetes bacterium]|nr:hypothetical protein [Gemmatimonadota bacterium]